jgi:peptide/nickel transport system permease protein
MSAGSAIRAWGVSFAAVARRAGAALGRAARRLPGPWRRPRAPADDRDEGTAGRRRGRSTWHAFWRSGWNRAGLLAVALLVLVGVFADFLASDKPIWLKYEGRHYPFPNVIDYPELRPLTNDVLRRTMVRDQDWAILPLVPYGPLQSKADGRIAPLEAPSGAHWLGTDDRGRDVLARVVHGTRISLSVGLVAVGLYILIGVLLGALAGFYGGWLDSVVTRMIEALMAFPSFFFILVIQGLLPSASIFQIMVVIGLTRWTDVARLVRGEVLRLRSAEFVLAARALGLPPRRILFRHVLPNAMGPVLVSATFGVAGAILLESALSFLGFGTPPPTASWGELLTQSFSHEGTWWLMLFPGLMIFVTVTAYNLVGEGIRDAVDPRMSAVR